MGATLALKQLAGKLEGKESQRRTPEQSISVAGVIESGEFQINLAEHTATLCQQPLELSSEEFDVLVFLVRHPQSVVTSRTVLTTNWTANRHRHTEFLRVLLSLREKLQAVRPGRHYLRTEPWVLYRFDSTSAST